MASKMTFPAGYDTADNICVSIPKAMIPIIAGKLLRQLESPRAWATKADAEAGRQAAYLLQERLMQGCS